MSAAKKIVIVILTQPTIISTSGRLFSNGSEKNCIKQKEESASLCIRHNVWVFHHLPPQRDRQARVNLQSVVTAGAGSYISSYTMFVLLYNRAHQTFPSVYIYINKRESSFVHLFVRSFVRSFVHLFVR